MAITIKVDTQPFNRLERSMIGVRRGAILKKAADFLRDELKNEPTKQPGAFTRLATPGQRRAFWAKVRAGQARVDGQGYVRTHNTARAWQSKTRGNFSAVVENAALPGAYFVYSAEAQQPFHAASKWPRVDTFAKKHEREIGRIIDREVSKILGG
jgi:hypothetical protein